MAKLKGSFGKFLAFATIAGAAAAGISYFTKYRSFHKELEEDFHDFEDDGEDDPVDSTMSRNYVPINPEKSSAAEAQTPPMTGKNAGTAGKAGSDNQEETDGAEEPDALYSDHTPDMQEASGTETIEAAEGTAAIEDASGIGDARETEITFNIGDTEEAETASGSSAASDMDDSVPDDGEDEYSVPDQLPDEAFAVESQGDPDSESKEDPIKKIDPQPDTQADTIIVEEFQ